MLEKVGRLERFVFRRVGGDAKRVGKWRIFLSVVSFLVFVVLFLRGVYIRINWDYSVFLLLLVLSVYLHFLSRYSANKASLIIERVWRSKHRAKGEGIKYYWSFIHPIIYWFSLTLSFLLFLPFLEFERVGITTTSVLVAIILFLSVFIIFFLKANVLVRFSKAIASRGMIRRRGESLSKSLLHSYVLLSLSFVFEALGFTSLLYFFGFEAGMFVSLSIVYVIALAFSLFSPFVGGFGVKEFAFSILALLLLPSFSPLYSFSIIVYSLLYIFLYVLFSYMLRKLNLLAS